MSSSPIPCGRSRSILSRAPSSSARATDSSPRKPPALAIFSPRTHPYQPSSQVVAPQLLPARSRRKIRRRSRNPWIRRRPVVQEGLMDQPTKEARRDTGLDSRRAPSLERRHQVRRHRLLGRRRLTAQLRRLPPLRCLPLLRLLGPLLRRRRPCRKEQDGAPYPQILHLFKETNKAPIHGTFDFNKWYMLIDLLFCSLDSVSSS